MKDAWNIIEKKKTEKIVKDEIDKWKSFHLSYKARLKKLKYKSIVKTFILSKIMFLLCIFPPSDRWVKKMNKMCCNFIWDMTREVAKCATRGRKWEA